VASARKEEKQSISYIMVIATVMDETSVNIDTIVDT